MHLQECFTEHCSDLLFSPTQTAVDNLARENITDAVYHVGDTMYDAVLQLATKACERSSALTDLKLAPKSYLLDSVHRSYNTDKVENMSTLLQAFLETYDTVAFPVHPRTRSKITESNEGLNS